MTTVSDAATARCCEGTPTVTVVDNRGRVVRTVQYNRSTPEDALDALVTRQTWSVRGQLATRIDPRLFDALQRDAAVPPNLRYVRSLSDRRLAIHSQDAGIHTALYDVEGGLVWQRDSRDQELRRTYDRLHRLIVVTEQAGLAMPHVSERCVYGDATASPDANLRGQLWRHYSTAGLNVTPAFGLAGQPLTSRQQFLRDDVLDSDWAGDDPEAWARDLAPDAYTTRWTYDALGQERERTDARGNRQRQRFNVAGQLAGSELQLAGRDTWQPLLRAITYSAAGQVLHEEAGNDVITDYTYEPQTQRLAELRTTRPAQIGRPTVLQALSYQYDPVGNLLAIEDAAQATGYTRNQRVVPASHYSYDALYQLTEASGREQANAGRQSQALPPPIVPLYPKSGELTHYTRTYTYDRGANLSAIHHQGTTPYTQQMVVARTSNRAVPQTGDLTPGAVDGYFDACGNLKELGLGQPLTWDSRNQLRRTTQIVRNGSGDDDEVYWYDGAGQRTTKLSSARTSGTTRRQRVHYLPGLELRQTEQTRSGETLPTPVEHLQVLTLGAAGRQSVRVLHWELGQPEAIENDQLRYSLDDQIGSSLIELDAQADLLSREEYYPYGGTAIWSTRSDIEAKYKYVRYSGQERDASGLYYYGLRYYAPWLARWLNPDPAGPVDGLNLFCMVGNNPIVLLDQEGLTRTTSSKLTTERREHHSAFLNMANIVTSCLLPQQHSDEFQIDADQIIGDNMNPMRTHVIQKLHYDKTILESLRADTTEMQGALEALRSRVIEIDESVKSIDYPFDKASILQDAKNLLKGNSDEIEIFGRIVEYVAPLRAGASSDLSEAIDTATRVREKTDFSLKKAEHEESIYKFISKNIGTRVGLSDSQSEIDRKIKNLAPEGLGSTRKVTCHHHARNGITSRLRLRSGMGIAWRNLFDFPADFRPPIGRL
ncbi:RHS repeat domain-containing protein [Burkholderia ubonensis]|uniref:RHS repeat domain-containing protein n=1 Tax=Burkholderia ubonensis TaxID=101571 RepID=UPI000B2B96F1|nr:RHS repeat-associated core domain-containing protein [Burkholderia ubonensis]